jgi:hypothetical protein
MEPQTPRIMEEWILQCVYMTENDASGLFLALTRSWWLELNLGHHDLSSFRVIILQARKCNPPKKASVGSPCKPGLRSQSIHPNSWLQGQMTSFVQQDWQTPTGHKMKLLLLTSSLDEILTTWQAREKSFWFAPSCKATSSKRERTSAICKTISNTVSLQQRKNEIRRFSMPKLG